MGRLAKRPKHRTSSTASIDPWEREPVSVLREWLPEDGEWYVAQLADAEIQRFTVESTETTAADFRVALTAATASSDVFARALVEPETGQLAGNLAADRAGGDVEVHYWLAANARGRGLATLAVLETCAWVATHWPDAERLVLHLRRGNEPSAQVAARCGFARAPALDRISEVRGDVWRMEAYCRRSGGGAPAS